MELRLTEEQRAAVSAPVSENLVSAAAGSGKTKVLSERIVKRIKSGDTSIDRLLIVTFTRSAAAQMRDRIYQALKKEYEASRSKRIKDELSMVAAADICTIDSFCIDVVRRNFFRLGVPSDFTIADGSEMKMLAEDALTEVLEECFAEGTESFLKLADSFGKGKNENALREAIMEVYRFSSSFAEPEKWLDDAVAMHEKDSSGNAALRKILTDEAALKLADVRRILVRAAEKASNASLDGHAEVFFDEIRRFDGLFKDDNIKRGFEAFSFGSFSGKKTPKELTAVKDELLAMQKSAKDVFASALEIYEAAEDRGEGTHDEIEALCACVKKFRAKFFEEKVSRRELEFSDCEYLAYKAVSESCEAADELRDKYDEIYIDEYQDTNPLQDAFFSAVSKKSRGEPNLFIVGDVKQSIYRFRHSDPTVFSEKVKSFSDGDGKRKMILSKNFRSRRDVVESVNSVFERIMREDTGGVEYDESQRLACGAAYVECSLDKSEIYLIDSEAGEEDELAREQKEALAAAHKIKEMVEAKFPVSENGRMRPARYSDFAVLTKAIAGKADMITKIFDLMDIPSVCSAEKDFYTSAEIRTAAAVLKAVDNPLGDIPLAAAMRSPFFSFSENELAEIRVSNRRCPFYENVAEYAKKDCELGKKCAEFVEKLRLWREKSSVMDVESFIDLILDESGYYSFVGALAGGAARQENLRTLMNIAAAFENTRYRGLFSFVRYLEEAMDSGAGAEAAEDHSEDSVKIMTIHKSKGLEFPIVILIGLSSPFNNRDAQGTMILNRKYGIGLIKSDAKRRIRYKTPEYRAIALSILKESRAEQMRLLYVAMTRAMEKLIMIGTVKSPEELLEKAKESSEERPESYTVRQMNDFLSYVLPSAELREDLWDIKIIDELPAILEPQREEAEAGEYFENEEVTRRLSYTYRYESVMSMPSKMSVSEIKRMDLDEDAVLMYPEYSARRVPMFAKEKGKLQGAARGTAYHRVLELIDLNEKDVKAAIANMAERNLIDIDEAEAVDEKKIEAFLKSPIADMMRNASKVMREVPFTMMLDSKDIFESDGEKVMVQGIIDCLIENADGSLVLLDYKTDRYGEPREIGEKYKKQLELYETAVFMKFSQKCDKKYLYLFYKDDIIEL